MTRIVRRSTFVLEAVGVGLGATDLEVGSCSWKGLIVGVFVG